MFSYYYFLVVGFVDYYLAVPVAVAEQVVDFDYYFEIDYFVFELVYFHSEFVFDSLLSGYFVQYRGMQGERCNISKHKNDH